MKDGIIGIGLVVVMFCFIVQAFIVNPILKCNHQDELQPNYEKMLSKSHPLNSLFLTEYHSTKWKCDNFIKNNFTDEQKIETIINDKVKNDILIIAQTKE